MSYPEHDKLSLISEESQTVGAFLDSTPYTLCKWVELDKDDPYNQLLIEAGVEGMFDPVGKSIERILAEHYEIDLDKIDAEKKAMLDAIRAGQEIPPTAFEGVTPPE